MFFIWDASAPKSYPFMVVAYHSFWRGEKCVQWVSIHIMSFCHEFVFNFVLKWAHYSHSEVIQNPHFALECLEHLSQCHSEMLMSLSLHSYQL